MSEAIRASLALLRRDLRIAFARRGDMLQPLVFAVLVCSLFPLALGPEAERLSRIAGGTVWVAVLLASLLSLDALFRSDADDGSLDQLMLAPAPLPMLAASKILSHWLLTGLPLILVSPLLGTLLYLPDQVLPTLLLSLALGTPLMSLIGAVAAALTAGMRRGGMLLTLLVLPLYVPVLIFGAGAVDAAMVGMSAAAPLYLLGAGLVLALVLAPIATAAALRLAAY